MVDVMVVTSKVKQHIQGEHELRTAGDVPEALSEVLTKIVAKAASKAKQEGRATMRGRDVEDAWEELSGGADEEK